MTTIPTSLNELLALSHATNPVFQGLETEKTNNRLTHDANEDGRCVYCDCRVGGVHWDFPCIYVANWQGVGTISTSTTLSSSGLTWTDVSLTAHYAGIDGERFWQVNCTRRGTSDFSIERFEDFNMALEVFKHKSNERG